MEEAKPERAQERLAASEEESEQKGGVADKSKRLDQKDPLSEGKTDKNKRMRE